MAGPVSVRAFPFGRRTRRRLDLQLLGARRDRHLPRANRALNAVHFAGHGLVKDVVSRSFWRKTKGDWDAWNAHELVGSGRADRAG